MLVRFFGVLVEDFLGLASEPGTRAVGELMQVAPSNMSSEEFTRIITLEDPESAKELQDFMGVMVLAAEAVGQIANAISEAVSRFSLVSFQSGNTSGGTEREAKGQERVTSRGKEPKPQNRKDRAKIVSSQKFASGKTPALVGKRHSRQLVKRIEELRSRLSSLVENARETPNRKPGVD